MVHVIPLPMGQTIFQLDEPFLLHRCDTSFRVYTHYYITVNGSLTDISLSLNERKHTVPVRFDTLTRGTKSTISYEMGGTRNIK